MKNTLIPLLLFALLGQSLQAQKNQEPLNYTVQESNSFVPTTIDTYFKKDPAMDIFITNLMKKMTLEEKLGQLNLPSSGDIVTGSINNANISTLIKEGKVGGVFNIKGIDKIKELQRIALKESRLHIPLLFGMDVIHGYETIFPIPIGLASSWDLMAIQKSAEIAAQEATADGINWTFSPMVDIARDPRWGRTAEGAGEDPFLGGQIAKAMVKGYQGKSLANENTLMACVKHFALYGAGEAGRDYNTVDMSKIRMYNEYFGPYKAAIDAGVGSVMAAFNEVDGIPATGNKWLQNDVLREQWKFPGFIVTDYTAIEEMEYHGVGDLKQSSKMAINAGIDMDMVSNGFVGTLAQSIKEGSVSIEQLDKAVKRILEAKYRLGLFEDPYRYINEKRAIKEIFTPEHREISRKIATQSMVLLENNNNILPLKATGKIAVIGPLANNAINMPGTWSVATNHSKAVSLFEGLKKTMGNKVQFTYAKGSNVVYDEALEEKISFFNKDTGRDKRPTVEITQEAIETAKQADVIILALGESSEMNGECSSRTTIDIPQAQQDLFTEMKKLGKPIVVVLFTGRALDISAIKGQADAILNVWFPGSEAGLAISDVLYGNVNPSGKLPLTFPRSLGQVPLFYNHKNTGRPLDSIKTENGTFEKFKSNYIDEKNTPLYPFGYGLSYTTFAYSPISLSAKQLKGYQSLTATVSLTNTGSVDGAEVVQLYIRDLVGSVTRPVKELKDFQKIFVKAGETKQVSFTITPDMLAFYNADLQLDWESGEFEIMIGTNSEKVQKETINWQK